MGPIRTTLLYICLALAATPASAEDRMAQVRERFTADFRDRCDRAFDRDDPFPDPESFVISYRLNRDRSNVPDRDLTLYQFECNLGAYNMEHVFYVAYEDGLVALQFATPSFEAEYAGTELEAPLTELHITGIASAISLINASFDAATNTISSDNKWRGGADASDQGTWQLEDGKFVLKTFDIDASFDEAFNPRRVYDATTVP